jgi:hypothetical protein
MQVTKITIGASHKLSIPGAYETVNPSISMTADIEPGEDVSKAVEELKARVDEQFWRLAYTDFATACNRVRMGTANWLQHWTPQQ